MRYIMVIALWCFAYATVASENVPENGGQSASGKSGILSIRPKLEGFGEADFMKPGDATVLLEKEVQRLKDSGADLRSNCAVEKKVTLAIASLGHSRDRKYCGQLVRTICFTSTFGVSHTYGGLGEEVGVPEGKYFPSISALVEIGVPSAEVVLEKLVSEHQVIGKIEYRNLLWTYLAVLGPNEGVRRLKSNIAKEKDGARKKLYEDILVRLKLIDQVPSFVGEDFQVFSGKVRIESP